MSTRRREGDFQAEIEAHIRLEADRLIAEGMPPGEAQDAARRAFGNVVTVRERFYEARRWLWFDRLAQDLRFGLRSLLKAPAFTATAVVTIALGVGANTAVFSLVDAVLLQSLPVQNPKELVFIQAAGSAGPSGAPPYPCFTRLRAETRSFEAMAAFSSDESRIEIDGKLEQVMGQVASGNYFKLLGLKPALGRLMDEGDERLDPPVVVISHRYWQRRFGGDLAVIGRTVALGQRKFTIIGVTPPEFWGMQPGTSIDITVPITIENKHLADPGAWWLHAIVARLKPGVPVERAQAESNVVFQSFMSGSRHPAEMVRKHFHYMDLSPAAHGMDALRRRFSKPLFALMGIVGLVLLMATANMANLLLARGFGRRGEFAIRLAMGAGRARLARLLLTETVLLFALGALPGVLFAGWAVDSIEALFAQGRRPITLDAEMNWRILAFSLAVTLAAGLAAGLIPAWRASRTDPEQAIKEGAARTSESRGSARFRQGLVVFQVALSMVLLAASVTFVRTLANLRNVDPGFRNEQVLTMSIRMPDRHAEAGRSTEFWSKALEAVRGVRGVRAAGLSVYTPLSGRDRGALLRMGGYEPASIEDGSVHVNQVSEGYFETLGIQLVSGRMLTERDAEGAPRVALINESTARKYFAGRDSIGQPLQFAKGADAGDARMIVGVVRDTKHMNLREAPQRFAYIPLRQPRENERRVTLAVASTTPDGEMALVEPIRGRLAAIDAEVLVSDVITMGGQMDSTLLTERLLSGLSGVFGALALILAAVGLYGVLSYRIGQQRQSIGIRMALGASPSSVALSVLGQSSLVVAAGLLVGLPFAILAARTADSMLWGVKSSDPATYLVGAAVLSTAGILSAYLPARRASAVEPAEALRHN